MILLSAFISLVAVLVVLTSAFAYLVCKLYIVLIDTKTKDKQEPLQPLLGVVYPKDIND